jgi:hypothetical protein
MRRAAAAKHAEPPPALSDSYYRVRRRGLIPGARADADTAFMPTTEARAASSGALSKKGAFMSLTEWAFAGLIVAAVLTVVVWLMKVFVSVTEEIQALDGIEDMHLDDQ